MSQEIEPDLTGQMRATADFLDRLNDIYGGSTYQWSPDSLRYEADYLDRPIGGRT